MVPTRVPTDADGGFAVPVSAEGFNTIRGLRAGFRSGKIDGVKSGQHGVRLRLERDGRAVLTGAVLMPNGSPDQRFDGFFL